jgi:anti-sigma factor RsiW
MECERAAAWLPRLVDGALGPWRRQRLAAHMRGCGDCAATTEELRAMSTALRDTLTYHRAPPGLAAWISASLPREAPRASSRVRLRWRGLPSPGLGWAGSGLAGALAGVALTLLIQDGGSSTSSVLEAVIDSHVRSMQADHLTDVVTSDRHTVKPWLSAHVDVSPPVRDLAAQGFPLVGGRLDYVEGRTAAVVVYRHAKHVINLFAWVSPDRPDTPLHAESLQGFNAVTWRAADVTYYAISDVEADQLMEFARDVSGQTGAGGKTTAE